MVLKYDRPLDYLNSQKGSRVMVKIRGQDQLIVGVLLTFDIHINILIYKDDHSTEFIKGDNIISIC